MLFAIPEGQSQLSVERNDVASTCPSLVTIALVRELSQLNTNPWALACTQHRPNPTRNLAHISPAPKLIPK